MDEFQDTNVLGVSKKVLENHPVCNHCLGRQFAWLSTNTSNEDRGAAIKLTLSMMADGDLKSNRKQAGEELIRTLASNGMFGPAKGLATKNSIEYSDQTSCYLCSVDEVSIFDRLPEIAKRAKAATDAVEFNSFLVGCIPAVNLDERQDEVRSSFGLLHGEALKSDINRELGKILQDLLDRPVNFKIPDIVIVYQMEGDRIEINRSPLFIEGRYRKLKRGIPQSRWDCGECRGKGCESCDGTGRKYPDSISEYIGGPSQQAAQGTKFKVHAAGREDIDVLMLGNGRPFVVEVSEPLVRAPNLDSLGKNINKEAAGIVEVVDLKSATRKRAQRIKEEASENVKEYTAIIQTESKVSVKALKAAAKALSGIEIEQRTPTRVSHRRSDLVRKKRIYETRLKKAKDNLLEGFFKVQGGTYVKELISGDDHRTVPSLTEKLETACECTELNVTAIYEGNVP
ncbi:MAG: tRNA pseudouridine(54/55) synthase Pus10 [Candidatus Thorarchaeota archaeon]|jgi:tRNA pseudouridine synthase 10